MATIELYSNISIQQALAWLYGEEALGPCGYDGDLGEPGSDSYCRQLIRRFESEYGLAVDGGVWGWDCQRKMAEVLTNGVQLTPHFNSAELGCGIAISDNDDPAIHSGNCLHFPEMINHTALNCLEATRQDLGSGIQVTSGVRCPDYNASLSGSSSESYHMAGRAFDCNPMGACSYEALLEIGLRNGFTWGYVGDGYVHLQYTGAEY